MMRYFRFALFISAAVIALDVLSHGVLAQVLPFNPTLYPGSDIPGVDLRNLQGSQGVVSAVRGLYQTFKQILAPIMVVLIGIFGVKLVLSGGEEETMTTSARHFLYILLGMAFVIFADFLSRIFFLYQDTFGQQGTFLSDGQLQTTVSLFTAQLEILIVFMRYMLGGIAVFYIVKSGANIIFAGGEDDALNKEKEVFTYGFVGFLLIMVSEAIVNAVFDVQTFPGFVQVNVQGGLGLFANITNFLLAIIGSVSVFVMVIGGLMYVFSAGNEERAKQGGTMIYGALIGIVIAFSSYTIVSEFSRVNPVRITGSETIPQEIIQPVPIVP